MHALVVNMATDPDRPTDVVNHLHNDVGAWARQQAGFIRGEWLINEHRDAGLGLLIFDTVEAATQAAIGPRHDVHNGKRAWNITAVTVYESIASAIK